MSDSDQEPASEETTSADSTSESRSGSDEEPGGGSRGFSFSLPPIKLPPLFPETLEIRLPIPGYRTARAVSGGWMLVVVLLFDIADALLAITVGGPVGLVRTLGGLLLAGIIAGNLGVLYLWEVLAVVLGAGTLTAFPSLVVVGILGLLREKRVQAERET